MTTEQKQNKQKPKSQQKPSPAQKPGTTNHPNIEDVGDLLDKFKITIDNNEFEIELYDASNVKSQSHIDQDRYQVMVNGKMYSASVESLDVDKESAKCRQDKGSRSNVKPKLAKSTHDSRQLAKASAPMAKPVSGSLAIPVQPQDHLSVPGSSIMDSKTLTAPMPGKILDIKVEIGETVDAGQPLVILEAMKMENVMTAPASGIVKDIPIKVGINVNQGDVMVVIE